MSPIAAVTLFGVAAFGIYYVFSHFDFIDIFSVIFIGLSLFVLGAWTMNIMGEKNG